MALRSLLGFGKRSLSFLSNSSKFSTRRFSSDHKKPGIIFEGINNCLFEFSFLGVEVHPPKRAHVIEGQAWGALLWFWVFYQTSENYDVILV